MPAAGSAPALRPTEHCARAGPGMLRVAVLVSGRGSNLRALIAARDDGLGIELVGVFSDRARAEALHHARKAGVPELCMRTAEFGDEVGYQRAFFATVAACSPDLIVCAGFMRIISAMSLASSAPMINIHPSLLPKYPGLDTHRRVIAAGDLVHGATVHRVTRDLDGGPLIAQVKLPVRSGDDPESLARRLLPHEHRLLVACVTALAAGDVRLADPTGVYFRGARLEYPLTLAEDGALLPVSKTSAPDAPPRS